MKVTNTEHTVINGNQSKCRMTQFNLGGALTKSGNIQVGGYSDSVFSPSSLIQNRIGYFGTSFVHLRRSALQERMRCTATAPAVQCILHANTCNLSRKYLRPSLQVLATAPASTCGKRRHYIGISSPMFFY